MKKFLLFDLMITPWVIRILYWIYQTVILVMGVYLFFGGRDNFFDTGMQGPKLGLLVIVGGSLVLRIVFEVLMVPFKICENTSHLKVNKDSTDKEQEL